MRKSDFSFQGLLLVVDFLVFVGVGLGVYALRISPGLQAWRPAEQFFREFPLVWYVPALMGAALFLIAVFALSGLYRVSPFQSTLEQIPSLLIALSAGVAGIIVFLFFAKESFDSRFIIGASWALAAVSLPAARVLAKAAWFRLGPRRRRVLLVGSETRVAELRFALAEHAGLRYEIVAEQHKPSFVLDAGDIDGVILADPEYAKADAALLAAFCEEHRLDFHFIPDVSHLFFSNMEMEAIGGIPFIALRQTPLEGWGSVKKRMVDIFGALAGIALCLPCWIGIPLAIRLESNGPALLKIKRVSQGKEFWLYKFRSMQNNAQELKENLRSYNERSDGPLFKMHEDPRVTCVGRFLRRWRFDELPQLFNVLKGEMSLVGPRPHEPEEVAQYTRHHKRTLLVKAGMTGLTQISGGPRLKFEEEVTLDLYYIQHWSFWLDFKILLKTLVFLTTDRSAY